MNTPLHDEVARRFGLLPNFFRLASSDPEITKNLWGFAQFAYLDNPLPSLFKERLFVYLSRFCEVRYCIARHLGFLVGLGYPAGDPAALPQRVEDVLPLLRRPLPRGDGLMPLLAVCAEFDSPLSSFPAPDKSGEQALFACATHLFLQTPDSSRAHEALGRALGPDNLERLKVFLAFVRTAHYWTKLHPELAFEDDVIQLLSTHETIAQCILKDSEAQMDGLDGHVAAELESLRTLHKQHETISQDTSQLRVDNQYLTQSLHKTKENLRELTLGMRAQQEALAKQKLESVGTLARGVAHDFNNLLNGILATTELALDEGAEGAIPEKELLTIRTAAIRGAEIVRQLMTYCGEVSSAFEPIDLSSLVDEMLQLLKVSISKQAILETDLGAGLPAVNGNPSQIRQVVMNLVTNASEALGGRAGVIRVTTARVRIGLDASVTGAANLPPGDYLELEVSDTGSGMTPEVQTRIFDPFFTTKTAGHGLGLAAVQGIVRGHGGAINIVSSLGQGARFQFLLPVP
jgi:signal transduction histidine kinase